MLKKLAIKDKINMRRHRKVFQGREREERLLVMKIRKKRFFEQIYFKKGFEERVFGSQEMGICSSRHRQQHDRMPRGKTEGKK